MTVSDSIGFRPKKLGLAFVVLVLLYLGYTSIRNLRIDALGRAAMYGNGNPTIVAKLASYGGERSADLLLIIAGGPATEENRLAAIHALVERKDVSLVSRLSALLVPPEPLAVRQAIAQALHSTGCSPECMKNVLYYEERISNGARPAEAVQATPPRTLSKQEQDLQAMLDEVLRKNKAALGIVLGQVYGLNTNFPSSFAIQTVERLDVREACPPLLRTLLNQNEQVRNSPEYQEVVQAVQILQCVVPKEPR
jgi:hypothetical protein